MSRPYYSIKTVLRTWDVLWDVLLTDATGVQGAQGQEDDAPLLRHRRPNKISLKLRGSSFVS